jgi:peptidoglycan/xylan/chitin deacetylase (PgdA/CDA1 family)
MSLWPTTPVTPATPARGAGDLPLAPPPSSMARARSRALHAVAAHALPSSVLFVRGARTRAKRVALTFDDGPDPMTPTYLDALGRLGVRATFFLVGENAARAPEVVREYVRLGHEVGAHGWSHDPFPAMSRAQLADELVRTDGVLPAPSRRRPMVRPPRGALSPRTLLRIATAGRTVVLWSVDSGDCRTRNVRVVQRRLAPSRLSPGDVVLLHEAQPWTLEALPGVVAGLRADGWELVTVGELMDGGRRRWR